MDKHGVGSPETSRKWVSNSSKQSPPLDLVIREGPQQYTKEAVNLFFDSIDGVVVVFDACRGVEEKHRRALLKPLKRYKMPIIVFVNSMDTFGASFGKVVDQVDAGLDGTPIPTQLPIGAEGNFNGIVDLIRMKSSSGCDSQTIDDMEIEVPGDMSAQANEWRVKLEESAAEDSDGLVEIYFGGEGLSTTQITGALRQRTLTKTIMPTLVGAIAPRAGIEALLDAVCEYFPSPAEAAPKPGPESKTPFFLTANLTATDINDAEKLQIRATEIARGGSYSVAVESNGGVVNIKGADILHIHELIEELRRTSTLEFSAEPTEVLYFETIVLLPIKDVEDNYEIDHQYAHVVIDLFNFEEGDSGDPDIRFLNDAKVMIPTEFVPACEKAFREACKTGPLKGSPITRLGMRLHFGSDRGENLRDSHFFQATPAAVKTAFSKAKFVLLEHVLHVEVEGIPDDCMAAVIADLSRRGAQLRGQEEVGNGWRVSARCPASSLLDSEVALKSLSEEKGTLSMEFDGYEI